MNRVIKREIPLLITAEAAQDIMTAIRIAKEFNISKDALNFLSTDIPGELDAENAGNYRKLQENVASLLLFQSGRMA